MKSAENNNSEKKLGIALVSFGVIAMLAYVTAPAHPLWLMVGSIFSCLAGVRRIGGGYADLTN